MNNTVAKEHLPTLLADFMSFYIKTLNYHWHFTGANFKSVHDLLDQQYHEMIEHIDSVAERIRTLEGHAPASLNEFTKLRTLKDGNAHAEPLAMIEDLLGDNEKITHELHSLFEKCEKAHDIGTTDLLSGIIGSFEKQHWMLQSCNYEEKH